MNKADAINYMINEVERIEKERLSSKISIDPNKGRKEAANQILKVLREVQLDDEN